jgi:geranylgeranyl diphosphate synthase type II
VQGVFGDPLDTGKSALSDLRSGKHTALIAHARGTSAWPAIMPYVGLATLSDGMADSVRQVLTGCGSRRYVEDLALHHLDRALRLCRDAGMPTALLDWCTWMRADLLGAAA